ncbi:hypothetical protein [Archangium primigenium]|uniref:hypothetical protein n=1 Tax=[Archangium] primigenium TaxID=2792470 RepID=UPI00195D2F6B|nr:hypothetical protein [Archangium primigenium]MBM7116524.1 hypothetical protein [Archangium primigenium]
MDGPGAWTIGRHTFRWEDPHILWVTLVGDNDLEEARQMASLYRALGERAPFYILADSSAAGGMQQEARRHLSEHLRSQWFQGVIFYNTRLLHRAMARGLILAGELFHAYPGGVSVMRGRLHFVDTQDEAQALVARLGTQEVDSRP